MLSVRHISFKPVAELMISILTQSSRVEYYFVLNTLKITNTDNLNTSTECKIKQIIYSWRQDDVQQKVIITLNANDIILLTHMEDAIVFNFIEQV